MNKDTNATPRTIKNTITGEEITFIQTAQDTKGKYVLLEVNLPPNSQSAPMHLHDEFEEEVRCISGKLIVILGKEKRKITLKQGDKLKIGKQQAHLIKNDSNEAAVFEITMTPPSLYEESTRIHFGLIQDGMATTTGAPKSIFHTALILTMQNTWLAHYSVYWQKLLFKFLVKIGHRNQKYKSLSKYTES